MGNSAAVSQEATCLPNVAVTHARARLRVNPTEMKMRVHGKPARGTQSSSVHSRRTPGQHEMLRQWQGHTRGTWRPGGEPGHALRTPGGPGAWGPGQSGRPQGFSSRSLESGRPHGKGDLGFGLKGHERGNWVLTEPTEQSSRVPPCPLGTRNASRSRAPGHVSQGRPGQGAPASVPRGSPQVGTLEMVGRRPSFTTRRHGY